MYPKTYPKTKRQKNDKEYILKKIRLESPLIKIQIDNWNPKTNMNEYNLTEMIIKESNSSRIRSKC